ncbi:unnamed protein product, partial [Closterium sp. NIES-53]
ADSSFSTLAKGSPTVPRSAFPFGTVTGMCVPSLRHSLVLARFTLNSSALYTLRVPIPQVSTTQAQAATTPCSCRSSSNLTILYHHQLGHPNFRTLADMASKKLLLGLPASLPPPPDSPAPSCLDCTKSKLRQQPHPASPFVAAAPLDLVHMDQGGKLGPKTQTCIYLGHNADSHDYFFLNPSTQQLVRSRDVILYETHPFYTTSGGDPPSGPPSLVWADFDAPPELPPAPAPSPLTSPAVAPSPSEVSNPTSPVFSAAAPPSPPSTTLPRTLAPPSSPIAHGTRSHGAAPPLALAIRCSVITSTPSAGGDVPSILLEDMHEELCDLYAVIPQLSHIFPDITESPSLNFSENPTIPIPLTVQEALSGPHAAEWRAATEAECESFTRNHSFDNVHLQELTSLGASGCFK